MPSSYFQDSENKELVRELDQLAENINEITREKGFWPQDQNLAEKVALVHSEASELLEGMRSGLLPSDKIPEFSSAEEECADIIIRVLDLAAHEGWAIGEAILAKMRYNEDRPHKHNRRF